MVLEPIDPAAELAAKAAVAIALLAADYRAALALTLPPQMPPISG